MTDASELDDDAADDDDDVSDRGVVDDEGGGGGGASCSNASGIEGAASLKVMGEKVTGLEAMAPEVLTFESVTRRTAPLSDDAIAKMLCRCGAGLLATDTEPLLTVAARCCCWASEENDDDDDDDDSDDTRPSVSDASLVIILALAHSHSHSLSLAQPKEALRCSSDVTL